jgi:hypothetical protein
MGGEQAAAVGLGALAVLLGAGGIVAAVRTRRRRAEIAFTYGSSGGIAYTIVQVGCSGVLMLGGVGMVALILISGH